MPFYAVHKGKTPGIYKSWEEAKVNVLGFSGAKFMKFDQEEDAALFLASGIKPSKKKAQQKEISEYFQTDLKGLERYGILSKKRPTGIKESDRLFRDQKFKRPTKDDPWSDYDKKQKIIIFTDGSCIEVKKSGLRKAGYGIHFPQKLIKDISGPLLEKPTNQRAELKAIYKALKAVLVSETYKKNRQDIYIFTDSEYSINCLTKWCKKWIKNNWMNSTGKAVENLDIIKPTLELLQKTRTVFQHVRAHTGKTDRNSLANHIADRLAFKASSDQID